MTASHELGRRGEDLAVAHLRCAGWTILDRNYRFGHREIDVVARRDGLVAFVEVKARRSARQAHPLAAIDGRKRQEIERVARAWIARHGRRGYAYRFDAVAVLETRDGDALIEHVEDAWRL